MLPPPGASEETPLLQREGSSFEDDRIDNTGQSNGTRTPHCNNFHYNTSSTPQEQQQQQCPTPLSSNPVAATLALPYKGFSTSLCAMFQDPQDCCAIACCGILQRDHTHALAMGSPPQLSLVGRLCRHIFIPAILLIAVGVCPFVFDDPNTAGVYSLGCLCAFLFYVIVDAVLTNSERAAFRREISRRAQGLMGPDLQQERDALCAHRICGCYSVDDIIIGDDTTVLHERPDMCTNIWRLFANMCCGMCGCWFVFCGICATAQESREMRKLVGLRESMVDYITFEHFSSYYPAIENLRSTMNGNLCSHYQALSKLSITLIRTLCVVFLLSFGVGLLDLSNGMILEKVLVGVATFSQAFIILYFVHWHWNRFDLSLDAVVKFFASGFLLTTFLAVFFELLESLFLQLGLATLIMFTGVKADINTYQGVFLTSMNYDIYSENDGNDGDKVSLTRAFGRKHPFVMAFYLMLNSYALAAFVEEVCKYYGYTMVSHPDFALTEEERQYCLQPHNSNSSNNETGEDAAVSEEVGNRVTSNSTRPRRSLVSIGAAVTIAMVAVSLGFACCENLIYVFIYAKGGVMTEIAVLTARSLFPVHPICAAIQSIGVCRRLLENDKSYGIGWTILPAILLHGTFDFSLMLLTLIGDLMTYKKADEEGNAEPDVGDEMGLVTVVSLGASLTIMVVGLLYFIVEGQRQRQRLKALDEAEGNTSRLI